MADGTRKPRRRLGRSFSGWVGRTTEHIDRFKTPLGLAVLALGAFLAYTAFKATTGPPFLPKYRLTIKVPADAPPLRKGLAVRVGGSLAGLVQSVEPDPVHRQTLVEINVSKTNFRPLPVDTTAFVRVRSIVYATYVSLQPGTSDQKLRDGDMLPAVATSGTDLLEVVQLFDRQAREDLSKTLVNVGFGTAGRGTELNAALRDLPETARNGAAELRAATSTPGALSSLISGAARTASGLRGERADDVAELIRSGRQTFGATANASGDIGESIELLRPFEDQVLANGPFALPALREIERTAVALEPAVRNLRAQLPGLNELATLGPELRKGFGALLGGGSSGSAGGGGGGSFGTGTATSGIANQVLVAARPVVAGLFPIQTSLKPLNAALAALLATIEPYLPEITEAGLRLQNATSVRSDNGSNPGAPFLRGVPVLTAHPCVNPGPAPGEAQTDRAPGGVC
jgi:ABC-type transporter Mla subunit MlaD